MTQPLVVFDNVTKHFGSYVAVEPMNLEIYKGEFVAIMGSSGCGKTTTLRMLAGLDKPSSGEIRLNGERVNDLYSWQRDTPLVWQNLALFPFLSVLENVEFGLRMRGMGKAERRKKALHWLERLDLGEFANRDISMLSGGQRQRVALARSLVTEPPILLLDEPLSALDAHLSVRMQAVLTGLQKDLGITFVYVTHSQSEAFAMADRVVIMSRGRVEQIGTPKDIFFEPHNRFVAEFVGGKNMLGGVVLGFDDTGLVQLDSAYGRFLARLPEDRSVAVGEEVTLCISAEHINLAAATDHSQPPGVYRDGGGIHWVNGQHIPGSRQRAGTASAEAVRGLRPTWAQERAEGACRVGRCAGADFTWQLEGRYLTSAQGRAAWTIVDVTHAQLTRRRQYMQQLTETSENLASAVRIGFLLAEGFDFYALAAALEPLRQANDVARCVVCEWQILSLEGQPLKANNGIVAATLQLSQAKPLDVLILCLGSELQLCTDDSVRESLALLTQNRPAARSMSANWPN